MRTPPSGEFLDLGERQAGDVDEPLGPFDAHFHEVEQIGAAAEDFGVRVVGEFAGDRRRVRRPSVKGKRIHEGG